MKIDKWTLAHLQQHLQYAIDLEFWTIPFYMSALYSIVDRTSDAFQYVQSVVNQEMLHLQLAANVANAYGLSPAFAAPVYGQEIPHLEFDLDVPNPVAQFSPYSSEIGPLDQKRINAMCLIEYPDWKSSEPPELSDTVTEYGNIGEFYNAVAYGAAQLTEYLHGGRNQIDLFSAYYRNLPSLTVTDNGEVGFRQVGLLIHAITEQGEGISSAREDIVYSFQNTATDPAPQLSHFEKFIKVRGKLPATWQVKAEGDYSPDDQEFLQILLADFARLRNKLERLFSGENPGDFLPLMLSVGADIQNCWKHGVTPRFD
jgi:ferritin-like protein